MEINSCNIGISLLDQANTDRGAASVVVQDSIFKNTGTGILINTPTSNWSDTTGILLDNVAFSSVTAAVKDVSSKVWLTGSIGSVSGWTLGKYYIDAESTNGNYTFGTLFDIERDPALTGVGNPFISGYNLLPKAPYFSRQKPQYTTASASQFVHMKSLAKGMELITI